ncbi:MAG TPA: NADH-ubiquinone oxidoreductase-F iron-sulfur binding region domain-containing protein [Patescibacteria group bacterium]|nr:NADH-ubiquinone oxidoreductase-F iron-sulfur binding region domain-containing protein [Patescibacteria group bacterium]
MSRVGPLPVRGRELIDTLTQTGLTGRGGAAFPVGPKWRAAAARLRGSGIVVVNGAEGEPRSKKDSLLMSTRPHLVLDGALLAAHALQAREIVLYVGEDHRAALFALERAVAERPERERRLLRMVAAPARYVAGESSAALHLVTAGIALPTSTPSAPALVQNVETLAHVALVARHGRASGTVLVTVAGAVARPGVLEMETSATVGSAIALAGGPAEPPRAILLGGYFGAWMDVEQAWSLPLDPVALKERGLSLGCGVIGVQPASRCPVCETSGIVRYLARESSAQCGPCFFGLRSLADACDRIAQSGTNSQDLQRLERWSAEVRGRGACTHPAGAGLFLQSALRTFSNEFAHHRAHDSRRTA